MDPLRRFFFMGSPHYPTMPLAGRPRSTDHREGEETSRQYLDQGLALKNHRAARIDSPPTLTYGPARAVEFYLVVSLGQIVGTIILGSSPLCHAVDLSSRGVLHHGVSVLHGSVPINRIDPRTIHMPKTKPPVRVPGDCHGASGPDRKV